MLLPLRAPFPRNYTTTLLAGERSGNLEEVLGRFIAFQRLSMSFRKKLIASLWYPAFLITALAVMLAFLMPCRASVCRALLLPKRQAAVNYDFHAGYRQWDSQLLLSHPGRDCSGGDIGLTMWSGARNRVLVYWIQSATACR